jgi:hypothetical protein
LRLLHVRESKPARKAPAAGSQKLTPQHHAGSAGAAKSVFPRFPYRSIDDAMSSKPYFVACVTGEA